MICCDEIKLWRGDFADFYIIEGAEHRADQKGPLLLIPRRWSYPKLLAHAQGFRACLGKGR
jgi:hypothetical protein